MIHKFPTCFNFLLCIRGITACIKSLLPRKPWSWHWWRCFLQRSNFQQNR